MDLQFLTITMSCHLISYNLNLDLLAGKIIFALKL